MATRDEQSAHTKMQNINTYRPVTPTWTLWQSVVNNLNTSVSAPLHISIHTQVCWHCNAFIQSNVRITSTYQAHFVSALTVQKDSEQNLHYVWRSTAHGNAKACSFSALLFQL